MSLKIKLIIAGILIILLAMVLVRPYFLFVEKDLQVSILKALFSRDSLKTYDNQVNLLVLGIGGIDHPDGPYLSDSIMVANYNLATNQLTTISIPRDIWSDTLQDKINSAYAYGGYAKNKSVFNPKDGLTLAKAEVSAIIGTPVQYAGVIDFNQFEALINFLGGIDVKVATAFDDYAYPIDKQIKDPSCGHSDAQIKAFTDTSPSDQEIWKYFPCRYEHVHFDKGTTHMDGATALIFVRSRHAEGPEGTDFAREARQQKVIEAVKDKLIDFLKKPDINKYRQLYQILDKLIKRDISNQQAAILLKNIILKGNFHQQKVILTEDLFINPVISSKYNGMWVLVPKNNDFSSINQYIKCYLDNKKDCEKLKNKGKQ